MKYNKPILEEEKTPKRAIYRENANTRIKAFNPQKLF